jgi:hypothetical protein
MAICFRDRVGLNIHCSQPRSAMNQTTKRLCLQSRVFLV